jgi:hypothetical protein
VLRLLPAEEPAAEAGAELGGVPALIASVAQCAARCRAADVAAAAVAAAERLGHSEQALHGFMIQADGGPDFSLAQYVQTFLEDEGAAAAPATRGPTGAQAAAAREVLREQRRAWGKPSKPAVAIALSLAVGDPAAATAAAADRGLDWGRWKKVGGAAAAFLKPAVGPTPTPPEELLHDDWCGASRGRRDAATGAHAGVLPPQALPAAGWADCTP